MMRSLYAGVSGLTSHQTKMDVIGNNIANVNTYGFKGSSVAFADIFYQTVGSASAGSADEGGVDPSQIGYGTQVAAITKNMSRSSFQSTASSLDLAIAGEGFIQVQDKAGNKYYTRSGSLHFDDTGNLVDSNGKFVLGTMNGDPTIAEGLSPDAGSDKIVMRVPDVHKAAGTGAVTTTLAGALTPAVTGTVNYRMAFNNGDQAKNITVKIAKDAAAPFADAIAYDPAATPATITFTIGDTSKITTAEALQTKINTMIEAELETDGGVLTKDNYKAGDISISLDTTGVTSGPLTSAQNKAVQQDAVNTLLLAATTTSLVSAAEPQTKANLTSLTVGENGVIIGYHPALGVLTFGRVDLATFDNPAGLDEAGNSYFSASSASGAASTASPGYEGSGGLATNALEMSNVNLAQEFSDMITAQRGFQANSRIITTSDSMLEELVNLKR